MGMEMEMEMVMLITKLKDSTSLHLNPAAQRSTEILKAPSTYRWVAFRDYIVRLPPAEQYKNALFSDVRDCVFQGAASASGVAEPLWCQSRWIEHSNMFMADS